MYFFRLQPLRDQLAGPGLTERDRFKYVMAWMLGQSLLMGLVANAADNLSSSWLVLDLLITFFGVVYAWRRNGRESGTGFFDRYFSIGWVVNFRTFVVFKIAQSVLIHIPGFQQVSELVDNAGGFASAFSGSDDEPVEAGPGAFMLVVGTMLSVYIAYAIGRAVGQVREATERPGPAGVAVATPVPASFSPAFAPAPASVSGMDRFVESVVQRELAQGSIGRRARGRSRIRPLRSSRRAAKKPARKPTRKPARQRSRRRK